MLRTRSTPYPGQPGYPGEGTGSWSSSHVPACAPTLCPGCPNCVARKSLLVQGHASGQAAPTPGRSVRAGEQGAYTVPAARPSPDHPSTSPVPIQDRSEPALVPPATAQRSLERSPSRVYITASVASSEQSRSLFGGWKSQRREGNSDRSCWGGGKTRRRIPRHSMAQLGAAAAHEQGPLMGSPCSSTPQGAAVQGRRKDDPQVLAQLLGQGVCDSHTRLGGSPSTHSSFS